MKFPQMTTRRTYSLLMSISTAIFIACGSDATDPQVTTATNNITTEAAEESYHEDAEDLAGTASAQDDVALTGRMNSSGKIQKWTDNRICDNTIITILKAEDGNSDTLTIDFGTTGCTDPKGNLRKGKLIVIYEVGGRWVLNGTYTVTTQDYSVNGVKVEGQRTVHNVSPNLDGDITWEIILVGGKLTFEDGTTATRATHHYRQWVRNGTPLNFTDDQIKILHSYDGNESTAEGTTRTGYNYLATVTTDLVWKATCLAGRVFIPVSGIKAITTVKGSDSAVVAVDFGDGTCDKTVVITVNGKSKTITINRDANG